jgi:osmoprotectant transport system substrate-binding protein
VPEERDDVGSPRVGALVAAAVLAAAVALTAGACGSGGGDTTPARSTAAPGEGKPPVVLGARNFTEQFVLGQLYRQALEAKGYEVRLRTNIASTERIDKALTSGQIDGYPEYTGRLLADVARAGRPPASAQAAYDALAAFERRRGITALDGTPFSDADGVAVKRDFAARHHLVQVGDLRRAGRLTLGGPREFEARSTGLAGMRRAYRLTGVVFKALSIGVQYTALDSGRIQAADVFATDARLRGSRYTVLADPRHVFGFQHVVPVFNRRVIAAQGPAFARTINAVSAKLTTRAMRRLNAAVEIDKDSPAGAAGKFLRANGLR